MKKKTQIKISRKAPGGAKRVIKLPKAPKSVGSNFSNPLANSFGQSQVMNVRHREMLTYVDMGTTFAPTSFTINPGLNLSFPWLSKIAAQFEQYRFKQLSFQYVGRCATSVSGEFTMAIDYDVLDPMPSSIQKMESYSGCISDAVWNPNLILSSSAMENKNRQSTALYTRVSAVSSDAKTYDYGKLIFNCMGPAASTSVGKLYVCYDVDLINPQTSDDVESLTTQAPKVPTSAVNLDGVDSIRSLGQHALQSILKSMFEDEGVPAQIIESFGKGNFTSILDAVSVKSSTALGLPRHPSVGDDADPYVLKFNHDWTGSLLLYSHVRVLKGTGANAVVTGNSVSSASWPYYGAGVPGASEDLYNHLYPWGVDMPNNSGATGIVRITNPYAGVGNTCSWHSVVSFDTHAVSNGGPLVTYDQVSTSGHTVRMTHAAEMNWVNCCKVDLSAKAGECFSLELGINLAAGNILYIYPAFVNSSSGPVSGNSDGRYANLQAFPSLSTGADDFPSYPDMSSLAPRILSSKDRDSGSFLAAEEYLKLVHSYYTNKQLGSSFSRIEPRL